VSAGSVPGASNTWTSTGTYPRAAARARSRAVTGTNSGTTTGTNSGTRARAATGTQARSRIDERIQRQQRIVGFCAMRDRWALGKRGPLAHFALRGCTHVGNAIPAPARTALVIR